MRTVRRALAKFMPFSKTARLEWQKAAMAKVATEEDSTKALAEPRTTSERLNGMMDHGLVLLLQKMDDMGIPVARSGVHIPDKNGGAYREWQITPEAVQDIRRGSKTIRHLLDANSAMGETEGP